MELCARLQQFQDRYDQAVRDGDAARLAGVRASTAAGGGSAS
ncbi:hypothetical protein ACIBCM_06360 [Streptomyces sp. NPDC051018]